MTPIQFIDNLRRIKRALIEIKRKMAFVSTFAILRLMNRREREIMDKLVADILRLLNGK